MVRGFVLSDGRYWYYRSIFRLLSCSMLRRPARPARGRKDVHSDTDSYIDSDSNATSGIHSGSDIGSDSDVQ